jgi:oxygen-independent coproporphyrinogen-3 oxidase
MVDAIGEELIMQSDFLGRDTIYTIYFGGGTPSLLEGPHLKKLMGIIQSEYVLSSNPEVTMEANPDDLTEEKLTTFFNLGVNRLSIGVQSFNDEHLKWMNRQHTSKEAIDTFHLARKVGFENISLDLIYALPGENHENWLNDLEMMVGLRPEHISSYCLTIEPQTAFGNWLKKGKIKAIDEDFAADQFEIMLDTMSKYGYDQYEISNFAQQRLLEG